MPSLTFLYSCTVSKRGLREFIDGIPYNLLEFFWDRIDYRFRAWTDITLEVLQVTLKCSKKWVRSAWWGFFCFTKDFLVKEWPWKKWDNFSIVSLWNCFCYISSLQQSAINNWLVLWHPIMLHFSLHPTWSHFCDLWQTPHWDHSIWLACDFCPHFFWTPSQKCWPLL